MTMIEQRIALEIKDKSLTKLAGNSYGQTLSSSQKKAVFL